MTLETGTLTLADYTAKIKDTGRTLTPQEKVTQKRQETLILLEAMPRLIAVGEGWVLKGLDESLAKAEPRQNIDLELPRKEPSESEILKKSRETLSESLEKKRIWIICENSLIAKK